MDNAALDISVIKLLSGEDIRNRSFKIARSCFYVCPVCGNVIWTTGEAVISCCGITLPPLAAEEADDDHTLQIETVEDEYYVTVAHQMSKKHAISFLAALSDQGIEIVKLYSQGPAEARFKISRVKTLYAYCNRHGLFVRKVK